MRQLKATPGVTPRQLADLRCEGPDVDKATHADAQRPVLDLAL